MNGGVFSVSRDIFDHPIVGRDPARLKAWLQMVAKACWKPAKFDVKGKTVTIDRGQFVTSYRQLSDDLGWTLGATQRFLACLKADTMIDTATDTGQLVLTICNYEIYQLVPYGTDTATDTPTDTAAKTAKKGQKTDTLFDTPTDTPTDTGKKVIKPCDHGLSQPVHVGTDTATDTPTDTLFDTQKNKKKEESKEGSKEGRKTRGARITASSFPSFISPEKAQDYLDFRRAKRAPITSGVMKALTQALTELHTEGIDPDGALVLAMSRNWQGFRAEWVRNEAKRQRKNGDDEFTHLMRIADDSDRRAAGEREVDDGADLQPDVPLMAG